LERLVLRQYGLPLLVQNIRSSQGTVGSRLVTPAQQCGDGIGEDDFPLGGGGLEPFRVSLAPESLFDPNDSQVKSITEPRIDRRADA
jgi:hypothetical protein